MDDAVTGARAYEPTPSAPSQPPTLPPANPRGRLRGHREDQGRVAGASASARASATARPTPHCVMHAAAMRRARARRGGGGGRTGDHRASRQYSDPVCQPAAGRPPMAGLCRCNACAPHIRRFPWPATTCDTGVVGEMSMVILSTRARTSSPRRLLAPVAVFWIASSLAALPGDDRCAGPLIRIPAQGPAVRRCLAGCTRHACGERRAHIVWSMKAGGTYNMMIGALLL